MLHKSKEGAAWQIWTWTWIWISILPHFSILMDFYNFCSTRCGFDLDLIILFWTSSQISVQYTLLHLIC